MSTKKELLEAAISRCQELQTENPTGKLVYDDELTRLLQAFMESPVSEDEAMQLMEKEKESIDVSDLDWDAYEKPMTLMEKFPDVSPMVGYKGKVIVDEPEIKAPYIPVFDYATLLDTAGDGRQTGKTMRMTDLIDRALEAGNPEEAARLRYRMEVTELYPYQMPSHVVDEIILRELPGEKDR